MISIKGIGYSMLGGGGTYLPLTPGVDPASQYATSPSPFTFVFGPAADGTAPYTYGLDPAYGTVSPVVSGSFPSYSFTIGVQNAFYVVTVTATDADGQVVTSYGFAAVGPPPDLLPPVGPSPAAALPSGTTSTTFSFSAFTGGVGTITYAASVASSGAGPSLSGSGLGPYTLSGLSAGIVSLVQIQATDTVPQVSRNWLVVAVQPTLPSDLLPGATPARQNLVFGTTGTNVTFNAASGGTPPYSYNAVLVKVGGSGASLAGSGLNYTVTGLTNGESVEVVLTATDSGAVMQSATVAAMISVDGTASTPITGPTPSPSAFQYAAGTTTAGPLTLGSWSASIGTPTVTATPSDGGAAGVTSVSGSGAGPYTVSLSGLRSNVAYRVLAQGTASDGSGRQANTGIAANVQSLDPSWQVDNTIDFRTVTTTTSMSATGDYSLTCTTGGTVTVRTVVLVVGTRTIESQPGNGIFLRAAGSNVTYGWGVVLDAWLATKSTTRPIFVEWILEGWTGGNTLSYFQPQAGSGVDPTGANQMGMRVTRGASADEYIARRVTAGGTVNSSPLSFGAFITSISVQVIYTANWRYGQAFFTPGATSFQPVGTGTIVSPGRAAYGPQSSTITSFLIPGTDDFRPAIGMRSAGTTPTDLFVRQFRYGEFRV